MILADSNLLIAFTWQNHPSAAIAHSFFQEHSQIVTCPLTELALIRIWMQLGAASAEADQALRDFVSRFRLRMIAHDVSATEVAGLSKAHRYTTDSYLAVLARKHGIKVATLDQHFAQRFPDVALLVA